MTAQPTQIREATVSSVASRAEAEQLCLRIEQNMAGLLDIIARETALLKSARLSAAADLEREKAEMARRYIADMKLLKGHGAAVSRYAPVAVDKLRRLHERFRAELQINLAVLATAKAVAEDLVRGVSNAIAKRDRAHTYGAQGRIATPAAAPRRGLAVNRSL